VEPGSTTVSLAQRSSLDDDPASSARNVAHSEHSLFDNSTLGVAITDASFRFLTANPAFLTMLGYSTEELQELSFPDLCIDDARDACQVPLREMREGARVQHEIETQYRRKDGSTLPVNAYLSAVSGRALNRQTFLAVTVDITSRHSAEHALRGAQSELTRVARLTTVGAMAASIAHELNQPLTSIVPTPVPGFVGWTVRSPTSKRRERRSAALSMTVIALPKSSLASGRCLERNRARGPLWPLTN
jgi:PAS domain S-box-containing protein